MFDVLVVVVVAVSKFSRLENAMFFLANVLGETSSKTFPEFILLASKCVEVGLELGRGGGRLPEKVLVRSFRSSGSGLGGKLEIF